MSTLLDTKPPVALPDGSATDEPLVSVVIPCLNEEQNITDCVRAAREAIDAMKVSGEVVVADNNSEDDSARLAGGRGAVTERCRGYGSALPGRVRRRPGR